MCEDLVVVEMGAGSAAGAATGMFLADHGARVLKVEEPGGDRMRRHRPAAWHVWNRGKESVVADLRTEAGQAQVRDLLAAADVAIEAFSTGQADAWSVGDDAARSSNPRLVYCSIKGFGSTGPYAAIKGHDAIVMAKAGLLTRGDFAHRPGPIFMSALLASNGASHLALSGIMAALLQRERTGVGQRVEATLYQGLNPIDYFMSYVAQLRARGATGPGAAAATPSAGDAPRTPVATRYGINACSRDGRWFAFSPQLPHQARALMEVLGLDAMLADERFSALPSFFDLLDVDAWEEAVCSRMKELDAEEWVRRGRANPDLPFEPILSAEEALDHLQLRHNGDVVTVDDPELGPIEQVGPIAAFSRTPARIHRPAPTLDTHDELPRPGRAEASPAVVAADASGGPPLAGITIVEFGYFYAMPYGVTLAAALGARVIKIEDLHGDPMRWSFGPPEWGGAKTMEGKESISLDLRSPEGLAVAHQLIAGADAFVLGFRPGVAEKLGMDEATLRTIQPDLLYLHASGYGSSGPFAHRPIYAGVASAVAGSVHRQSGAWLDPSFAEDLSGAELNAVIAPRLRALTDGDANAALAVLSALMLGLRHRARTGEGQFATTSMIGGNAIAYADDFVRYAGKEAIPHVDPEQFGTCATNRLHPTAEGWVALTITTESGWRRFVAAAEATALASDLRFRTEADRQANDDALVSALGTLFATRTAADWEADLVPASVACVEVSPLEQSGVTATDPALRAMGLTAEIDHPLLGRLVRYGAPVAMSAAEARLAPGCTFAQHTASLLAELGYDETTVARLAEAGAIGLPAA